MKKVLLLAKSDIIIKSIINLASTHNIDLTHLETARETVTALSKTHYDLVIGTRHVEGLGVVELMDLLKSDQSLNATSKTCVLSNSEDIEKLFNDENRPDFFLKKDQQTLEYFETLFEIVNEEIKNQINLLYVDDDKFIRMMIDLWTKPIEHISLTLCKDLDEVRACSNESFSVIVSDNQLKDGTVLDVLKILSDTPNKDVPVYVYTGTVANVDRETLLNDYPQVEDVLPKPFELKAFLSYVSKNPKIN